MLMKKVKNRRVISYNSLISTVQARFGSHLMSPPSGWGVPGTSNSLSGFGSPLETSSICPSAHRGRDQTKKQSEAEVVAYLQHIVATETLDVVSH